MTLKEISECSEENKIVDKKGICVVKYVVLCTRPHIALSMCPENCTWNFFFINTLGNLDHEGTWHRNLELHLIHPSGAYDFTFRATESSYTPWGANTAICTQNKDVKA